MSDVIDAQRDAALRRVGRNLVNFQKLEASLKQILPNLRFAGPLREVQALQSAGAREVKKKSLGDLANRLHSTLFAGECRAPDPAASTEITVAHSVRVELDSTEVAETKKALARLVRERNRLVHSDLLSIDFNSIPACEELCIRLDEQNERICAQINHLQALRQVQSEALTKLKDFIDSDEFLEVFSSDSDDA